MKEIWTIVTKTTKISEEEDEKNMWTANIRLQNCMNYILANKRNDKDKEIFCSPIANDILLCKIWNTHQKPKLIIYNRIRLELLKDKERSI